MKKRIISFITAICLTVAVLPFKNYIDLFKNSMTAEAYANIDESNVVKYIWFAYAN